MTSAINKNLANPDETRNFPKGKIEIVKLGNITVGRATFEPGWRWSECVKPIAGTSSCQVEHTALVVSGRLHVRMENGTEFESGPGDVSITPPGHDAWVLGDEPVVFIDFGGAANYAKPS